MKRIAAVLVIFLLSLSILMASNEPTKEKENKSKCTITGTVNDKITGEPLAGVEIKLLDSDKEIYSDLDGKFEIKDVEAGTHSILINYISYQDFIENVDLEKGNTTNVSIKLKSVDK